MPLSQEQLNECAALKKLFTEKAQMSQREFAAKYQVGTAGFVWQLLNGRRPLNLEVAVKFAKALQINISEFSPRLAQKQSQVSLSNIRPTHGFKKRIPILSYVQAGDPTTHISGQNRQTALDNGDFLFVDEETPDDCFAMQIEGNSMLPLFKSGDMIIVNPSIPPQPGDFVVAAREGLTDELDVTFKKYRPRGFDEHGNVIFELTPLNDDFPTYNSSVTPFTITGVVVEHRRKFR